MSGEIATTAPTGIVNTDVQRLQPLREPVVELKNLEVREVIPAQQSKCNIAARALNERKQQCGRELDSVESFS